jgi:hypothetical protein
MRQNQSKQTYLKWLEGDPTQPHTETGRPAINHCLTLHLPEGDKITFYYLYLVKAELRVQDTLNIIILRFTSDKVTLQGYRLEKLFNDFSSKRPKDIYVCNPRYALNRSNDWLVIEANVEERK